MQALNPCFHWHLWKDNPGFVDATKMGEMLERKESFSLLQGRNNPSDTNQAKRKCMINCAGCKKQSCSRDVSDQLKNFSLHYTGHSPPIKPVLLILLHFVLKCFRSPKKNVKITCPFSEDAGQNTNHTKWLTTNLHPQPSYSETSTLFTHWLKGPAAFKLLQQTTKAGYSRWMA